MPRRTYKLVNASKIKNVRPVSGYEWIENRFGTPPGIPKDEKKRLDELPDKVYVHAYLTKPARQIRSLMVSENERRRSFRNNWPYEHKVKGEKLAKAGFYYLRCKDQVKCAFCLCVVDDWNCGDDPMERHNRHFSFCRFVQGKDQNNIPFDEVGLGSLLLAKKNAMYDRRYQDARPEDLFDILSRTKPCKKEYSDHRKRVKTFKETSWPKELEKMVSIACDAGFIFTGPDDRCACFYCGGTLEEWSVGDDPWEEHAKWYYKCPFLIRNRGGDFIRSVRVQMSPQDRHESENLRYGLVSRNGEDMEEILKQRYHVRTYKSYRTVSKMGYTEDILIRAYQHNEWKEYKSPEDLLHHLFKTIDNQTDSERVTVVSGDAVELLMTNKLSDQRETGEDSLTLEELKSIEFDRFTSSIISDVLLLKQNI